MLNIFLSLIIFCMCINYAYSQNIERTSLKLPYIGEPLSIIKNATGWIYTDEGQWLSSRNSIPCKDLNNNFFTISNSYQPIRDFSCLEIRKIIINDISYSLLLVKDDSVTKHIGSNYYNYTVIDFYIITSGKLKEILPADITFNKSYAIDIDNPYSGRIEKLYDYVFDKLFNKKNSSEFTNSEIAKEVQKCVLNTSINTSNNLAIFLFPVIYNNKKYMRFILNDSKNWHNKEKVSFDPKIFDHYYYEIEFEIFELFINGYFKETDTVLTRTVSPDKIIPIKIRSKISEEDKKVFQSFIQSVLLIDSMITRENHSEFWSYLNEKLENEKVEVKEALINELQYSSKTGIDIQRFFWLSAKETIKQGRVIMHKDLYPSIDRNFNVIFGWLDGEEIKKYYNELLIKISQHKPLVLLGKEELVIDEEYVNKILFGLEGSQLRLKILFNEEWDQSAANIANSK